jgi:predicted PurR-regulated permease PerM
MAAAKRDGRGQRFLLALSVILLLVCLLLIWPIRSAVAFALIVGYLLHPVYERVQARVRSARLAASLMLIIVGIALVSPIVAIAIPLAEDAQRLAGTLQDTESLTGRVASALERMGMKDPQAAAAAIVSRVGEMLQSAVLPAVRILFDFIVGLIIFFILLFFIFIDGRGLASYVRDLLPLDDLHSGRLMRRAGERVRAVIYGTILVGAVQGAMAGIGWWILGFPNPIFWGVIMTLLSVIPILGAFIVLLPAAAWAFLEGNVVGGVGLIVLNFIIVGLVDDVLRPFVIGRQSGVHPAVVLLGIVGGFVVFGIAGFVLGPVLLSLVAPVVESWAYPEREPLRKPRTLRDRERNGGAFTRLRAWFTKRRKAATRKVRSRL